MGGTILGLVVSVGVPYVTVPVWRAYQRRREKKMADRIERASQRAAALALQRAAALLDKDDKPPRP